MGEAGVEIERDESIEGRAEQSRAEQSRDRKAETDTIPANHPKPPSIGAMWRIKVRNNTGTGERSRLLRCGLVSESKITGRV